MIKLDNTCLFVAGARVILGCRNVAAGHRVRDEIVTETGNVDIVVLQLDLSSLQSVRRFADDVITGLYIVR